VQENGELWVFGYGSLMWRPGFPFVERRHARVHGYHRPLCVYSHVHRGTPERPGLVLGLDRGGRCHGVAFRVAAEEAAATIHYLREREQVTNVYIERVRPVVLVDHPEARVQAVCYMVDRSHPQYAAKLSLAEQLRIVRHGHGKSGANRDYVLATVHALEAMGCRDRDLHLLAERLRGIHEAHGETVHAGVG
jgi:cation transport protein ChaC